MKYIYKALCIVSLLLSTASFSAIGPYSVVLIHGFQPDQLQSRPDRDQVAVDGSDYWQNYWLQHADARIDWPAHERIEGKIASDYLWPALKTLSEQETCLSGCLLVTHSTGDLVARYLLDNQENWLTNAGLQPLNIVGTFDFAGAGGGVELANIAVNVTEGGGWLNHAMKKAVSLWMGQLPSKGNIGVLNDLKVANARQLAMWPDNRVPRIRFVGNGSDFLGATSPFIPGSDDGVVAAHSACGAADADAFDSCSTAIEFDGQLDYVHKGVRRFMPSHYPLLMGDKYSHLTIFNPWHKGKVTATDPELVLGDQSRIAVETVDEDGWFGKKYRFVRDSDRDTLSELVHALPQ
ncbi:hypothetical protein BGL48_15275 [Salinivibrio sp. SS3]|uniref:hypothetical protein n=1 Tax=Salinivibrio sp. SS3 TaxID=1895021 RepID=UPI0008480256|nr:hypothetical protein [Salinivibrio sp. BNH]ODP96934.1 hypothetical protein BGL48_15275 [Salinivibrio sp. BNH]